MPANSPTLPVTGLTRPRARRCPVWAPLKQSGSVRRASTTPRLARGEEEGDPSWAHAFIALCAAGSARPPLSPCPRSEIHPPPPTGSSPTYTGEGTTRLRLYRGRTSTGRTDAP